MKQLDRAMSKCSERFASCNERNIVGVSTIEQSAF